MDERDIPANCGKRLLPVTIDEIASAFPSRPWASMPKDDTDLSKGYEDISYAAFANAINKVAWFLDSKFGHSTTFQTIFYLGAPDIRYHVMQMAVCKTGHTVLFSSHLNSLQVHRQLIAQTNCKIMVSSTGVNVDDLLETPTGPDGKMSHAVLAELDDLLDLQVRAPNMPYTKTYDEGKNDPYVILHSSGSTGDPKAIVSRLALAATEDAQSLLPKVDGWEHLLDFPKPRAGVRYLVPTAPYYSMAALHAMTVSVFSGATIVFGYRQRTVGPADIPDILQHSRVTSGLLTPWYMEEVALLPNAGDFISLLDIVFVGGASPSPEAREVWTKYCRFHNIWGATELITVPQLRGDPEDQSYNFFDTVSAGIEFRDTGAHDVGDDGKPLPLYKMVFVLTPESARFSTWHANLGISLETHEPPYPELTLGDLWTPHPDPRKSRYAWRFVGRADDLVIFSTGVKAHPAPVERALQQDPRVSAALMLGHGHRQGVVLVELVGGVNGDSQGHETVLSTPELASIADDLHEKCIKPANARIQIHGRIARTHLIVVAPEKFVRTSKGSVAKKETQKKFQTAIDTVYERFGDIWQNEK
ncbi:hypothetical protein BX600DRAFT_515460 [Xylariales sp. PMI_506]|nr:hypothetical protein BX600DRAFT_515460 [Xylariales sp. PMI_506]